MYSKEAPPCTQIASVIVDPCPYCCCTVCQVSAILRFIKGERQPPHTCAQGPKYIRTRMHARAKVHPFTSPQFNYTRVVMASKQSISCSEQSKQKQANRQVFVNTFEKWQSQHEKEHKTLSWLRCDKQQKTVESLWCLTCRRFEGRIRGCKNYSAAWITGSTSQKLSNVLDHARSDQHKLSMSMFHTEQAKTTNTPLTAYAPIAKSLLSMDISLQEKVKKISIFGMYLQRKT